MKISSWREFDKKTSNLEKEIDKNVRSFKYNHPLLDRALNQSFSFLPSPFNTIAGNIYNLFQGSEEDKSSAVLSYFNYMKNQGEFYYYNESLKYYDYTQISKILNSLMWCRKGDNMNNLGKKEMAIEYYSKALNINPNYAEAWNNMGVSYQRIGNYGEALRCYSKALDINPNFILAYENKVALSNQPKTDDEEVNREALLKKGISLYNNAQSNPSLESKKMIF